MKEDWRTWKQLAEQAERQRDEARTELVRLYRENRRWHSFVEFVSHTTAFHRMTETEQLVRIRREARELLGSDVRDGVRSPQPAE